MINHATNNETGNITVALYLILNWYSEWIKWCRLLTLFVWHVQWTPSKYKDSLRIILLATKDARIHDLEGIYMVAVYHAA